jgi:hypothetical protein
MVMINDPGSLPAPMWAVVRMFATAETELTKVSLQCLLSPPSISSGEGGVEKVVGWAIATLGDLGVVHADGDRIRLTAEANALAGGNIESMLDFLRTAIIAPDRNTELDTPNQTGPRDLVRALVWFLTLDPLGQPMGWDEASRLQAGAFAEDIGLPFSNSVRWNRFFYWASVLGFASRHAFLGESRKQALVPDCSVAVRQTVRRLWPMGTRLGIYEFVEGVVEALPVLPEGRYGRELGVTADPDRLSRSLSFALLCGHDQGWITLGRKADSQHDLALVDPDLVNRSRRITDVEIHGSNGG